MPNQSMGATHERFRKAVKSRLVALEGHRESSKAKERKILLAALSRLDRLNQDLEKLRPRSLVNADAAERYQNMILERGKLHVIIERSRKLLR